MATAAACRSATVGKHMSPSLKDSEPFAVFEDEVDMSELTGEPGGEGWSRIECVSKKAYGCGDLGETLVEGLRLYVRFGDYPVLTSSLALRMSEEAVRRIEAVLNNDGERTDPDNSVSALASFCVAGSRLIAIMLVFLLDKTQYRRLGYHLVYDAVDSSLSLIDDLPDGLEPSYEHAAVLNRAGDGGGDYELVVLAEKFPTHIDKGLLCMCTPDSRAANTSGPWKVMGRRYPEEVPWPFLADLSFAFQGKAFWAKFTEGHLLYCDLPTCCSRSPAEFVAIRLPPTCLLDPDFGPLDEELMMVRTMGCVGDSICLVCIDRAETSCADDLLTMWTLDLAKEEWEQQVEISAKELWQLDCFKSAGLPETSLNYPVLTADGALCLVIPDESLYSEVRPIKNRMCCFDVHGWNLLWHGHVHDYEALYTVMLPSNFFKRLPGN